MYEVRQFVKRIIPAADTSFGVPFTKPVSMFPRALFHFDGANGSSEIIDATGLQNTNFANNGPVVISNTQSKFGGTSGFFNNQYLALDGTINIGYDDFTIDCWVFITSLAFNVSIGSSSTVLPDSWWLHVHTDGQLLFTESFTDKLASAVGAMLIDTWYHVALTRASGNFRLFLDGQIQTELNGGVYDDGPHNFASFAGGPLIGNDTNLVSPFLGYIDEFRILQGIAQWTNTFTPPTAPYLPVGGS